MEEPATEETNNNINDESNDLPIESVELNTMAGSMGGDVASLMHGPEEQYDYLPGWGGGRNGTVAPVPEVREGEEEENNESRSLPQEQRMMTVSFSFPSGLVPFLLIVNLFAALILLGCYGFIKERCDFVFQETKPDSSYVNATLPSLCLPPGWHRNYTEEFPAGYSIFHPVDPYYEALNHQHDDYSRYRGRIHLVGLISSLSSAVALFNLGTLALAKQLSSSTYRRCSRVFFCFYCCSPALGLRLRVLSCLALAIWATVSMLLHILDIWAHGQLWWIIVIVFYIAAESSKMVIYDAYRRHAMPKESGSETDASLGAPLLGPNPTLPQQEGGFV